MLNNLCWWGMLVFQGPHFNPELKLLCKVLHILTVYISLSLSWLDCSHPNNILLDGLTMDFSPIQGLAIVPRICSYYNTPQLCPG